MFFHSVFRMNSKFSTFSTIVRIGCWGEDRFFSRWLRVSGRISFLLAAAIGYEGSFLLNFVSLLNLVFSFRPSAIWIWRRRGAWWAFFAHGFPRIAERGLRSLAYSLPLGCRKRFRWMQRSVSPIGAEDIPFFLMLVRSNCWKDVSTRCCDPSFQSPNELLKATFSNALAMLWKTSCFRRWAFIMWVSCASAGIYR